MTRVFKPLCSLQSSGANKVQERGCKTSPVVLQNFILQSNKQTYAAQIKEMQQIHAIVLKGSENNFPFTRKLDGFPSLLQQKAAVPLHHHGVFQASIIFDRHHCSHAKNITHAWPTSTNGGLLKFNLKGH